MPAIVDTLVVGDFPARGGPWAAGAEPRHGRSVWVTGLTYGQVEDLLDWLGDNDCTCLEVSCREREGFAVHCACSAGWRLEKCKGGGVHLVGADGPWTTW